MIKKKKIMMNVRINVVFKLTVHKNVDRILLIVDGRHNYTGEDFLVFNQGPSNEQAELVIDADPLRIIICGLNRFLAAAGMFD